MKKLKSYLFYIAMLSGILMFSTNAFAIEGEGTAALPFLITNQEELKLISDFPEAHFKLMNDIECSSKWNYSITFYGVFDGNNFTIKNYYGKPFIHKNYGTIKNVSISTTDSSVGIESGNSGLLVCDNYETGKIINSFTYGYYASKGLIGGLVGYNVGVIDRSGNYAKIYCSTSGGTSQTNITTTTACAAGFVYSNAGIITNSFSICDVSSDAYSYYWSSKASACGFVYNNTGSISNCYSTTTTTASSRYGYGGTSTSYLYPFICTNSGTVENCFYDESNTANNNITGVISKSTTAMKMKQTYTNAGWDFENVWGISPTINDGYPYLLWEYPEENIGSAKVEINDVVTTDNSIKYISETTIEGEPDIDTFGTTFIPLQLLDNSKASAAVVQYNNAEYNISNGQTYGAALNNIPESCKDMYILGKSFIKDSNGNYTWSAAKYSSINDTSLHEAN